MNELNVIDKPLLVDGYACEQVLLPSSIVYRTKYGGFIGKHTNDMTESAEKWLKKRLGVTG